MFRPFELLNGIDDNCDGRVDESGLAEAFRYSTPLTPANFEP